MPKWLTKVYESVGNIIPIYYIEEGTHIPQHIHNLTAKIVSAIYITHI